MNDPNGMVFHDGRYHLFHQHNPDAAEWGNIHWGHAVSHDLLRWTHRPNAIAPHPELGLVASGCAVFDERNTSGLGNDDHPPLVAMFTHLIVEGPQVQSLAFSTDGGATWREYERNPVLADPSFEHFRDPKVFWHAASDRWVMVLAAGQVVRFYASTNLIEWTHLSDFGEGFGAHGGVWETPDLFELRTDSGETRWVLLVSIDDGGPNGGSATQYFVGTFDGTRFAVDDDRRAPRWLDYGPDFYACVTWSNAPDGRRIALGWMSNWAYAAKVPTTTWRGAMTVPRELFLMRADDGLEVHNRPIDLSSVIADTQVFTADEVELSSSTFVVEAEVEGTVAFDLGTDVRVRYDGDSSRFVLDRTNARSDAMSPLVDVPYEAGERVALTILVDRSTVEVFVDDGAVSFSALVFPDEPIRSVRFAGGSLVRGRSRLLAVDG